MSRPVKLIALLKAVPGMSRREFDERWRIVTREHVVIPHGDAR